MCKFYNKSSEPCVIWFYARTWDPGDGSGPKNKHRDKYHDAMHVLASEDTVDGLGGMSGQLVVTTAPISVPRSYHWNLVNYQERSIDDNHGYFVLENTLDSNQQITGKILNFFDRENTLLHQDELKAGSWSLRHHYFGYEIRLR